MDFVAKVKKGIKYQEPGYKNGPAQQELDAMQIAFETIKGMAGGLIVPAAQTGGLGDIRYFSATDSQRKILLFMETLHQPRCPALIVYRIE